MICAVFFVFIKILTKYFEFGLGAVVKAAARAHSFLRKFAKDGKASHGFISNY